MNECITCGSKDVDCRMTRYFVLPGMYVGANSYLLCDLHNNLRYTYEDIYDENGNRKNIDHEKVIERGKK